MISSRILLPRLVVPCGILVAAGLAARADAGEYARSYTVASRANVHVSADNGRVRVITSDTHEVKFHVTYEPSEQGAKAAEPHIDSRQSGDRVELAAHTEQSWPFGFDNLRMNIEVQMPREADLQVETSNGAVEVSTLNGNIEVHTSNGHISAERLSGTIDIQTSNGGVRADQLKGAVKVHTSNGAIGADNLDGKCELATSNGYIQVSGRFDQLDLRSSNGRIEARAEAGSRMSSTWNIVTQNAGVHLAVPADFKATLDASTVHGSVVLGLPATVQGTQGRSEVHGTMNGGGPALTIETRNGSIRVDPI
jgi:hypothetical protein